MSEELTAYTGHLADLFARVTFGALTEEVLRGVPGAAAVTPSLLGVLESLYRHGTLPVGELSRGLGVSYAAGSQFVHRLEKLGLLKRGEDAHDRRRSPVQLTPDGERLVRAVEQARAERLDVILSRMAPDGREALVKGLEAFLFHVLEDPRAIEQLCGRCHIEHSPACVVNRVAMALTGHVAADTKRRGRD